MKKNKDTLKTAELLKKLQETVLASQKRGKKEQEPSLDRDELEFQKKIAGMLSKVTGQESAEHPKASPNKREAAAEKSETSPKKQASATETPKEPPKKGEAVAEKSETSPKEQEAVVKKPEAWAKNSANVDQTLSAEAKPTPSPTPEKNKSKKDKSNKTDSKKVDSQKNESKQKMHSVEESILSVPPHGMEGVAEQERIPMSEAPTAEEKASEKFSVEEKADIKGAPLAEDRVIKEAPPAVECVTEESLPAEDHNIEEVPLTEEIVSKEALPPEEKKIEEPSFTEAVAAVEAESEIAVETAPETAVEAESEIVVEAEPENSVEAFASAEHEPAVDVFSENTASFEQDASIESTENTTPMETEESFEKAESVEIEEPFEKTDSIEIPSADPIDKTVAVEAEATTKKMRSASADSAEAIRIPRPAPAGDSEGTDRSNVPQVHAAPKKPLVVVIPPRPPADLPRETKSDSIVIKPKNPLRPSAPIVIKASEPARTAEPTRVEVKKPMPKSSEPIRITPPNNHVTPQKAERGGVADTASTVSDATSNTTSDTTSNTTASNPKAAAAQQKPTPPKKRSLPGVSLPGVSLPGGSRSVGGRSAPIRPSAPAKGRSPARKHSQNPSYHHSHPTATEEGFDIALESVVSEEPLREELSTMESAPLGSASTESRSRRPSIPVGEMTVEALLQHVERKTGMNRDDLAMIFALGYDHELGRLIGRDAVKRLKTELTRQAHPTDPRAFKTAFGYRNREYVGDQSPDLILANYTRDKKRLILRIAITALMLLLLLPLELAPLLGNALAQYRSAIPPLFPLLSMAVLLTAGGFSLKQLGAGLSDFFRMSPTPYSVSGLLFPIAVAVGILNIFLTGNGLELTSLHLPAVLALLITALCDAGRLISEMRVFRILSAEGDKLVIEAEEPGKQKLRHGDKIVKIINDDVDHNLYRLRRALRISGFFRRCNDFSAAEKPFGYVTVAPLILAFPVGLICSIRGGDLREVFSSALLTLAFAFPIPAVLLYFYPLCRVNRQLTHRNAALIGEESVVEFNKQKTLILRDSDMYTVQKRTQTMLRSGEDFKRDMRLAEALFQKINGNTDDSDSRNAATPVALVRIVENGTEAVVDNQYHLLAGSAEFLTKNGVRIPKESTDRALGRDAGASLMYVAIGGVLRLIYEIEYAVTPKFEQMVAELTDHKAFVAIRTCDPNINEAFLLADRGSQADFVRVMKQTSRDTEAPTELSDCGAVALGNRFDAIAPVVAAVRIQRLRTVGYRCLILCSALGAAIAAALTLSQNAPLPGVALLLSLLFQGALTGAFWLISRILLRLGWFEHQK